MRVPTTDAITRRSLLTTLTVAFATGPAKIAVADDIDRYHDRVRSPSQLLLQQDYYYIFGTVPPRQITAPKIDQPQWNAFGSCVDNSCTYVPLQQRYNAYAKYEGRLTRGLDAFRALGGAIEERDWPTVSQMTRRDAEKGMSPPPAIDALLKAGLLASAMLISPNNLREKKEASLATFYVNEVSYAIDKIAEAAAQQDGAAAREAWEFGRDSWNSYLAVLNPAIVPKVGDTFDTI